MKKIATIGALCLAGAMSLQAQSHYDANRLMQTDLNGTARFVGMGGAMGALGGDVSTIGTNPAGMGIYRSNDVMVSFGFNRNNTESQFAGNRLNSESTKATFDNAGFVYSKKIGTKTALRYFNFSFNYSKAKGFNRNLLMAGEYTSGVSQTDQMANQSNGLPVEEFGRKDVWDVNGIGWLSILGWEGYLTYENNGSEEKNQYLGFPSPTNPYGKYQSRERGGINQYDVNFAFNISDRVFLGFTFGIYDVDYARKSAYYEGFDYTEAKGDQSFYTLENYFQTTGTGYDVKFGLIARPFADSPLRIGAAVHSPTIFNLRDYAEAALFSDVAQDDGTVKQRKVYTPEGGVVTEYKIVTPWTFNLSAGYTVGQKLALGAEYEFCNYGKTKIKDYNGTELSEADGANMHQLKKVHTVRAGLEFKPLPALALRVGYNHATASLADNAYKVLPFEGPNSVRTDTEYANTRARNSYTAGVGYRIRNLYIDVAYQCHVMHEDFYPFDNVNLQPAEVKNMRHQGLMTIGVRF